MKGIFREAKWASQSFLKSPFLPHTLHVNESRIQQKKPFTNSTHPPAPRLRMHRGKAGERIRAGTPSNPGGTSPNMDFLLRPVGRLSHRNTDRSTGRFLSKNRSPEIRGVGDRHHSHPTPGISFPKGLDFNPQLHQNVKHSTGPTGRVSQSNLRSVFRSRRNPVRASTVAHVSPADGRFPWSAKSLLNHVVPGL